MTSILLSLVYRNLVSGIDKVTIVVLVFFPIIFLFTAGYSFSSLIDDQGVRVGEKSIAYPAYVTSGFIAFNAMNSSLIAGSIIWNDRQNGMFHQILTMPFTRLQHVIALILTIIVISLISSMFIVAAGFGNLISYAQFTLWTLPCIIFGIFSCAIFFGSISIIICNSVRTTEGFFTVTNVILLLFGFASTALYPSYGIPDILKIAFYVNPLTYASDVIRAAIFSINAINYYEIFILAILSCVTLPIAVKSMMSVKL